VSGGSIKKYFENNLVSFSQSQYYKYCKILQKYGEEGLFVIIEKMEITRS
jgi:hypothetical protein